MGKTAVAFLGLLFFCILTLWAPGYWPVALFLFGSFVLAALELRNRPKWPGGLWLTLALPVWAGLQWGLHAGLYSNPGQAGALAALSYVCVAFVVSRTPGEGVERFRLAMAWFAFLVAVEAILQRVSGGKIFWAFEPSDVRGFVMGPILYHNHWAVFVEIALPLAIYQVLGSPMSRGFWLYSTMAATLYASVVISASRSGVMICTGELLAVPVLVRLRYGPAAGLGRAAAPLAAALVACVLVVGPDVVIERLQQDPTLSRADWNRSSVAMLRDRPLRGVGLGNWPVVYPQYATFDDGTYVNQAHNDWLQWFVEGGVVYGCLFLAIAVFSCRQAWRFPWAAGVPAVFCQAMVDYPFSRPALAAWTFTVFGLTLAAGGARGMRPRAQRGRVRHDSEVSSGAVAEGSV